MWFFLNEPVWVLVAVHSGDDLGNVEIISVDFSLISIHCKWCIALFCRHVIDGNGPNIHLDWSMRAYTSLQGIGQYSGSAKLPFRIPSIYPVWHNHWKCRNHRLPEKTFKIHLKFRFIQTHCTYTNMWSDKQNIGIFLSKIN